MSRTLGVRATLVAGAVAAGLLGQALAAGTAGAAALAVNKIELKNGQLLVEGTSQPGNTFVSVESTVSAIGARPDASGRWKAQATGFSAPDCRLTVRSRDTSPVVTVSIPNCTPSAKPVPAQPAPPTGSCVITPQPTPATLTAGTASAFWMHATGCSPNGPLWFTLVAGTIPTGMTMGTFQDSTSGNIIGTPSVRGTYRFTVQAQDAAGATDQENFAITVV